MVHRTCKKDAWIGTSHNAWSHYKERANMTVAGDITIVGAGPYGLSIAAYLRGYGIDFRIVGSPMQSWLTKMPKGMLLKSAGFASTLYDPGRTFTLQRFCKDNGMPYHDLDYPIPLETFCAYGIAFQQRFAPNLEDENLVALRRCPEGFELQMESGKSFKSRKVVLGVGIDYFRHVPAQLAHLPRELVSHSADHHDLQGFRNREVAVLGSGASATDLAILLHEAGARVQLIARKPTLPFGGGPWGGVSPSLWRRVRAPVSGIGPGWRSRFYTGFPWLYRYFPENQRIRTSETHPGPAGGWFMKERAEPVPALLGYTLQEAKVSDARVQLYLAAADGSTRQVSADHLIAATGYKTDVRRLPFLSRDIFDQMQLVRHAPRVSAHFESSVPGLYFVGVITAASFGPVMRFAVGADFTSRRLSKHFAQSAARRASSVPHKANPDPSARSSG